ncbi:MAG: glycosyl hydrolase family 8 [Myxococcota bacterium]|nr:glycosyl hydrolase family 8 [Myxococcota bacterium]
MALVSSESLHSRFITAVAACAALGAPFAIEGCSGRTQQPAAPVGGDGGSGADPGFGTMGAGDASSGADSMRNEAGTRAPSPFDAALSRETALPSEDAVAPATSVSGAALGHCAAPLGASWLDAQAAYSKWKSDLLTSNGARGFLRVDRPNSPGSIHTSNSEGIAYGMILAVAMNDQPTFDSLWKYEQLFLDGSGLMNWEILPDGSGPTTQGTGAATDADEDMAFALLWADHRWGGRGSLADAYRAVALKQIALVWQSEVDHSRGEALKPGDQFPGGAAILNISYFAPAYYRLFGVASGDQTSWNKVVESSYAILAATLNAANKNTTNGLLPAWSTPAGAPQAPNANLSTDHQLDSCRVPFRVGQDYCWYGEGRAKEYLARISTFYQQIGARNIVDGYTLDGLPRPSHATVNQSAAFVGAAGVGAMSDPAFAMLRDQAYAGVATLKELDGSLYYTESWTALSLVMMIGGFWNPAAP